jgi:hypothetical protein
MMDSAIIKHSNASRDRKGIQEGSLKTMSARMVQVTTRKHTTLSHMNDINLSLLMVPSNMSKASMPSVVIASRMERQTPQITDHNRYRPDPL